MALNQHLRFLSHSRLLPFRMKPSFSTKCSFLAAPIQCMSASSVLDHHLIVRRSANYQPSPWHYDYIQSLKSEYMKETYEAQSKRLKEEVRIMLCEVANPLDQLELIDTVQRLGVAYHFNIEIRNILESLYQNKDAIRSKNLHATALEFRILRQHGYDVSTEVFNEFQDDMNKFKIGLSNDIQGMLSLYEASFLSFEDETIMDEARDFTIKYLKEYEKKEDDDIVPLVRHALEIPLHWRMPRLEARWFIDEYPQKHNKREALLKFAKLDFNIAQAVHQEDLKDALRWWQRIGLGEKLSFARDRLVQNFYWTVGLNSEPQFGNFRREMAKVIAMATTIDDVYDVYGTLEELELFTNAVERWDINAADSMLEYMKICFLALYNITNELAFQSLKEKGYHATQLRKAWAGLCKAYLKEAKWYFSGYKPGLQEYMENAWISIAAPAVLSHAYFLTANPITREDLYHLERLPPIIRYSGVVSRLADDLGTSQHEMEIGDVPKSIQCYMNENGAFEENAREHVRSMINETWKKMNKEMLKSSFSQSFVEIAVNTARMAQSMYEHGDGHGYHDPETENRISSLLFKSIPIV